MVRLPELNETVTTEHAIELCRHFNLDYLVERIKANPDAYKPWKFDGCSCLPDEMLGLLTGCDWRDVTYKCCLPHDLAYAYGIPGDEEERRRVDQKFRDDLITQADMAPWIAAAFYGAVRVGGAELGLSFSWAFAAKEGHGR